MVASQTFEQPGLMKHVFLTGASSGIGLATAHVLLACGHEVWGTARDPARLPQQEHFHPVQLDLRHSSEIDGAFLRALRQAGHFDVVINNAGSGHFGAAEFLPISEMADQFQILFFAPARLIQLALATMRPRETGLIINVTSLAERLPVPFMAAYNAAKAALAAFTMSMQVELAQSRIRLIDLQPADICTNFNNAVSKSNHDELYSAKIAQAWKTIERNLKNAPEPNLVARHVVKLIERASPAPRLTVGSAFQARVAPLIFRFLPQRLRIWGLRKYYRL
jgi:NAD(P)-dependent dehydrogenase (short-subunit alcohol dehydrogenase family)